MARDQVGVDRLHGQRSRVADRVERAEQAHEVRCARTRHQPPFVGRAPEVVGPLRGGVVELHRVDVGAAGRAELVDGGRSPVELPRVDGDAEVAVGERVEERTCVRQRAHQGAARELDRDTHAGTLGVFAQGVDRVGNLARRRPPLADHDRVRLVRAQRACRLEHERARRGPQVGLAGVVRTRPRDERVDLVGEHPGVVEEGPELLGREPFAPGDRVRLGRP